jgi:hypothetical protein
MPPVIQVQVNSNVKSGSGLSQIAQNISDIKTAADSTFPSVFDAFDKLNQTISDGASKASSKAYTQVIDEIHQSIMAAAGGEDAAISKLVANLRSIDVQPVQLIAGIKQVTDTLTRLKSVQERIDALTHTPGIQGTTKANPKDVRELERLTALQDRLQKPLLDIGVGPVDAADSATQIYAQAVREISRLTDATQQAAAANAVFGKTGAGIIDEQGRMFSQIKRSSDLFDHVTDAAKKNTKANEDTAESINKIQESADSSFPSLLNYFNNTSYGARRMQKILESAHGAVGQFKTGVAGTVQVPQFAQNFIQGAQGGGGGAGGILGGLGFMAGAGVGVAISGLFNAISQGADDVKQAVIQSVQLGKAWEDERVQATLLTGSVQKGDAALSQMNATARGKLGNTLSDLEKRFDNAKSAAETAFGTQLLPLYEDGLKRIVNLLENPALVSAAKSLGHELAAGVHNFLNILIGADNVVIDLLNHFGANLTPLRSFDDMMKETADSEAAIKAAADQLSVSLEHQADVLTRSQQVLQRNLSVQQHLKEQMDKGYQTKIDDLQYNIEHISRGVSKAQDAMQKLDVPLQRQNEDLQIGLRDLGDSLDAVNHKIGLKNTAIQQNMEVSQRATEAQNKSLSKQLDLLQRAHDKADYDRQLRNASKKVSDDMLAAGDIFSSAGQAAAENLQGDQQALEDIQNDHAYSDAVQALQDQITANNDAAQAAQDRAQLEIEANQKIVDSNEEVLYQAQQAATKTENANEDVMRSRQRSFEDFSSKQQDIIDRYTDDLNTLQDKQRDADDKAQIVIDDLEGSLYDLGLKLDDINQKLSDQANDLRDAAKAADEYTQAIQKVPAPPPQGPVKPGYKLDANGKEVPNPNAPEIGPNSPTYAPPSANPYSGMPSDPPKGFKPGDPAPGVPGAFLPGGDGKVNIVGDPNTWGNAEWYVDTYDGLGHPVWKKNPNYKDPSGKKPAAPLNPSPGTFGGSNTGGGFGSERGGFGGPAITTPGRATGGPVTPGTMYEVIEPGGPKREFFLPNVPGKVVVGKHDDGHGNDSTSDEKDQHSISAKRIGDSPPPVQDAADKLVQAVTDKLDKNKRKTRNGRAPFDGRNPLGRAGGGPVQAGSVYHVGEPDAPARELFVPHMSGAIAQWGGGNAARSGTPIQFNFNGLLVGVGQQQIIQWFSQAMAEYERVRNS